MLDFNDMIHNYLQRELRPKQVGRYYPSECGGCIRKGWYSYKQPKEFDKELIKVFELGNMIHDFIVDVLKSEKNPNVELVGTEIPFRIEVDGIVVSGRIDDIILLKIGSRKYIVEVKSTSSLKYTKEPNESHVYQLQLYMHHMGIHQGIILYIEKNTLQSKHFEIPYDKEKAEEAIERLKKLHSYLVEDKLPEAEAKLDESKIWQCKFCQYKEECDAAD